MKKNVARLAIFTSLAYGIIVAAQWLFNDHPEYLPMFVAGIVGLTITYLIMIVEG